MPSSPGASSSILKVRVGLEDVIDPLTGHHHQCRQIPWLREHLGPEARDLAARTCCAIHRAPTDYLPHNRINGQTLSVVEVIVTGESALKPDQPRHPAVQEPALTVQSS